MRDLTPDFLNRPTWRDRTEEVRRSEGKVCATGWLVFLGWLLQFSHLVQTFVSQVEERPLDAGRKRLARLLGADQQRDGEDTPSLRLRWLGLPGRFRNSPAGQNMTGLWLMATLLSLKLRICKKKTTGLVLGKNRIKHVFPAIHFYARHDVHRKELVYTSEVPLCTRECELQELFVLVCSLRPRPSFSVCLLSPHPVIRREMPRNAESHLNYTTALRLFST